MILRNLALVLIAVGFVLGMRTADAEVPNVTITVDGLACPFCAYGVEKKVKKLDFVHDLDISLNRGEVRIGINDRTLPHFGRIRDAVRDAGFTPRKVKISVIGSVRQEDGKFILYVRHSKEKYILVTQDRRVGRNKFKKKVAELSKRNALVLVSGMLKEDSEGRITLQTDSIGELHTVELSVDGMACERCEQRIEKTLQEAVSVYRVKADHETKKVVVESVGAKPDRDNLSRLITGLGFSVLEKKSKNEQKGDK